MEGKAIKKSKSTIYLFVFILLAGSLVVGCGEAEAPAEVYTGEAEGGHGPVVVEVTMEGDQIVDIEVVEEQETDYLGPPAFEELIPQIIDAQSTEGIDAVAGATVSSEALFEAVNEALDEAN